MRSLRDRNALSHGILRDAFPPGTECIGVGDDAFTHQAREMIAFQVGRIKEHWDAVCEEASLKAVDKALLWERQFLNAYAFEGYA